VGGFSDALLNAYPLGNLRMGQGCSACSGASENVVSAFCGNTSGLCPEPDMADTLDPRPLMTQIGHRGGCRLTTGNDPKRTFAPGSRMTQVDPKRTFPQ